MRSSLTPLLPPTKSTHSGQCCSILVDLLDRCRSPPPSLRTVRSLHARLLLSGGGGGGGGDHPALLVKLNRAYAACGDLSCARLLFDSVPGPLNNTVFFNVMIRSYVFHSRPRDALRLLSSMSSGPGPRLGPNHYTYPCALKACSDAADLLAGLQLHAAVACLGLDANLFMGNALITMYARYSRFDHAF
ncbi:putative pentatricopeptide repeat-containing protein [Ananas comosus]|uniref:Putative pentatricopeptide repeat-containing protein n=1 Tax=Ananas comosus TaxID=4615 RepID=A0A199UMC9_ANACO|nr:putative pentatricopeptide repeat-containing protein [Ananas comosus]